MAKTWTNTVPQGVSGTGNATIFGQNPLANQFAQQLTRQQELDRQDNLLRHQRAQQRAAEMAKAWKDMELDASAGIVWAAEMAAAEQGIIERGIKLRQQGVDPYGASPEALSFRRDLQRVKSMQGYRKAIEDQYKELGKLIRANPEKYDPSSIKAMNDFLTTNKLSDAYAGGLQFPALTERFDVNDFLKSSRALTKESVDVNGNVRTDIREIDVPGTENMLLGQLGQNPQGRQYVQELTSGFSLPEMREFSTDYNKNVEEITKEINGNPEAKLRLAQQGITTGTFGMQNYISDVANARTEAKRKFDTGMRELVDMVSTGINQYKKETPNFEAARYNLARQRENRLSASASSSSGAGNVNTGTGEPKDITLYYGEDGKEAVTGLGVISLSKPNQQFQGTPAYDLYSNEFSPIKESASKFEIVSIGNYPVAKQKVYLGKNKPIPAGGLVGNNFAKGRPELVEYKPKLLVVSDEGKYLIDPENMPKNRLTKKEEGILASFRAMSGNPYQRSQPPQKTSAPSTMPKKGETRKVQGGTAIFDGTKWIMKK